MKVSNSIVILLVALGAAPAFAEATTEAKILELGVDKAPVHDGWTDLESVTGGSNVIDQQNVEGQQDGTSNIYTLDLAGSLNYRHGQQTVSNTLAVSEAFSRTAALPRMVKSTDDVQFVSMYRYFFNSGSPLGLYGRVKATTAAFTSYDERANPTTFIKVQRDGSTVTETEALRSKLAAGFAPQEYKEAFGVFIAPLDHEALHAEVRTGPAALQSLSKGAYIVNKKASKGDTVELDQLGDSHALGAEAAIEVKGVLLEKKLDYVASVESLYPLMFSPKADNTPESSKLVSYEAVAALRYKLSDWLGLSVQAKSKRNPLVRPEAEVTKSALLTATLKKSFLD